MYFSGFLRYQKKKDTVFCLLGAQFWQLQLEKKRYSCLSVGCAVLAITTGKKKIELKKRYIMTGKKRYSRLSDGCAVLAITTGKKKDTVISGNFHYDR